MVSGNKLMNIIPNYCLNFIRDPITGFRRKHTLLKIYNLILNYGSRKIFKTTRAGGFPLHLNIESTNICNLSCPMCSTNSSFTERKKGQISFENYKKIIDEIGKYLYVIGPFNLGEPLLHKDIFKMISYAQQKNISTFLSTNGLLLKEDLSIQIINSGLEKLLISVDAASESTYAKLRKGGDFPLLIKNIKTLVQEKRIRKSKTPFIIMQMIITKDNEHEVEEFKKLAKELGVDKYIFSNFWEQSLGVTKEEKNTSRFYPAQEKYRNIFKKELKVINTCSWAWSGSVINWDGTVVPCCFDYNETYIIGNAFKEDFKKLWNNSKYRSLRKEIKNGRAKIQLCKNCPYGVKG